MYSVRIPERVIDFTGIPSRGAAAFADLENDAVPLAAGARRVVWIGEADRHVAEPGYAVERAALLGVEEIERIRHRKVVERSELQGRVP